MPPSDLPPPTDLPVVTNRAVIDAAARAIVYCYVEWSVTERHGRPVILDAIAQLRAAAEPIPFKFYAIEEDAPAFADWIAAHEDGASGSGVVIWLESGRPLATEVNVVSAGATRLVSQTRDLWGNTAP
jgi:hypothetical protein